MSRGAPSLPVRDTPVLVHRLEIIAAAALFSTGGAAIKACAMTSWQVASLRSLIAAVTLLLLVPAARRGWGPRTVIVGATYATTMILFVLANKLTTAASTIFLQSTAPLYILVLAPWLLGEHLRRRDLAFMAALAVGLGLLLVGDTAPSTTAPHPALGNLLGGASGLFWGLTIMGLRALGRTSDSGGATPVAAAALGNLIAGAVALPFALPMGAARPEDWGYVLFLGTVQIGLAYVLLTRGVGGVPALEASLLLLAEPVLSPLWAWLAHGEVPGPWANLGGAVILLATAVNTLGLRARR